VEQPMRDVIFAIGTIVFFAVSILYLRACERLK
jgi:cbb3-type cytochrome oxidase subunit 3